MKFVVYKASIFLYSQKQEDANSTDKKVKKKDKQDTKKSDKKVKINDSQGVMVQLEWTIVKHVKGNSFPFAMTCLENKLR